MRDYEAVTKTATTSRQPKKVAEELKQAQVQTAVQPMGASGELLRLQRRYGNRHVQRVVNLPRQGEVEASVEPGVEQAFGSAHHAGPLPSGNALLDLQRMYGTRAVQGIVAVARQKDRGTGKTKQATPSTEKKRDVVIITSPDVGAEAPVLAPNGTIRRVESLKQMASVLRDIKHPLRTLFISSHSLPSGDLGFGSAHSTTFELPSKVAQELKGTVSAENAPDLVDFRGCTVGTSPKAMDEIKAALGAGAAIGGNCYLVVKRQGPISLGGKQIAKPGDVNAGNRDALKTGLAKLIESFGETKKCILDTSEEAYFRAGGRMIAQWFSPELTTMWNPRKSVCYKDLKPETVDPATAGDLDPSLEGHCRLIRVEKK